MIRRPPRSTLDRSSAASDVYKRQALPAVTVVQAVTTTPTKAAQETPEDSPTPVSYTHLRAHETVLDLVCRLLLAKKHKYVQHITLGIKNNTH